MVLREPPNRASSVLKPAAASERPSESPKVFGGNAGGTGDLKRRQSWLDANDPAIHSHVGPFLFRGDRNGFSLSNANFTKSHSVQHFLAGFASIQLRHPIRNAAWVGDAMQFREIRPVDEFLATQPVEGSGWTER